MQSLKNFSEKERRVTDKPIRSLRPELKDVLKLFEDFKASKKIVDSGYYDFVVNKIGQFPIEKRREFFNKAIELNTENIEKLNISEERKELCIEWRNNATVNTLFKTLILQDFFTHLITNNINLKDKL